MRRARACLDTTAPDGSDGGDYDIHQMGVIFMAFNKTVVRVGKACALVAMVGAWQRFNRKSLCPCRGEAKTPSGICSTLTHKIFRGDAFAELEVGVITEEAFTEAGMVTHLGHSASPL